MNFQLIVVILESALGILTANKTIPQSVLPIVSTITGLIPTLIAAFHGGSGAKVQTTAVLVALEASVSSLKANTDLSPEALAKVDSLLSAVQAAIAADSEAQQVVDVSRLTGIEPV